MTSDAVAAMQEFNAAMQEFNAAVAAMVAASIDEARRHPEVSDLAFAPWSRGLYLNVTFRDGTRWQFGGSGAGYLDVLAELEAHLR